uniref:FAS1 domain-containing protein n=1 Tax=Ananas comosus var. bracteatus TaxID=296719 RepID=A0A6V7P1X6_ANACO|nr:unnamed protein product [Ananas comosus var. bracteatus]
MASKLAAGIVPPFIVLLSLLSLSTAHNITEILAPFSEYSTFNNLLSQTKLADEINQRQTITVLVLDNAAISPLSSLPHDALKNALAVHVLLDYYDPVILDKLGNKSALLTTLFQGTGAAAGRTGFLNYTELPDDQMVFGSSVPGAPITSTLIKVVAARPYNISVLQISSAIIPPGLEGGETATTPPPTKATSPPPTSVAAPKKALAPTPTTQPIKLASPPPKPNPTNDSTTAPTHADAPKASPPTTAATPPTKSVTPPPTKAASPPTNAAASPPAKAAASSPGKAAASPPEKAASSPDKAAASPPSAEVSAPSPTTKASTPSPTAASPNIDAPLASPPSPTIMTSDPIAASPNEGSPTTMPTGQHSSANTLLVGLRLGFAMIVLLLGAL